MGRYWWSVWIKVGILAVVLILAYTAVNGYLSNMFEPYLLDETAAAESEPVKIEDSENIPDAGNETENAEEELAESGGADVLKSIVEKIENKVGVYIDYESFIFDYANDYAQRMMEESRQERNVITEPLS